MNKQLSLIAWIKNGLIVIALGATTGLGLSAWQIQVKQSVAAKGHQTEHLRYNVRSLLTETLQSRQSLRSSLSNPNDRKSLDQHAAALKNAREILSELQEKAKSLPETTPLLTEVSQIADHLDRLFQIQGELLKQASEGAMNTVNQRLALEEAPLWSKVEDALDVLNVRIRGIDDQIDVQVEAATARLFWILAAVAVLIVLLPLILFFKINGLLSGIRVLLEKLERGANNMTITSQEFFNASSSFTSNVEQQSSALQETSVASAELSSMVQKTAEGAKKTQGVSADSFQSANEGKAAIQSTLESMDKIAASNEEIREAVETNSREFENIVNVIAEIGEKTKVINEIVFQTKLLSFNASVEAARAGESGKGFAVVAEEVGNLAAMSGNASKEISELLQRSIETTQRLASDTREKVSTLIKTGQERVEDGIQVARKCGDVLDKVVRNSQLTDNLVREITHAAGEQATGIAEISKAIAELDRTNNTNAAAATQVHQASLTLSASADEQKATTQDAIRFILGAKSQRREEDMDFDAAIAAHTGWKMKLNNYLARPDGSLNPEVVCKDDQCALGKWIYGRGHALEGLAEYEPLRQSHAEFHATAAEIIRLAATDIKEAQSRMKPGGPFLGISERTIELIRAIQRQAQ